ncbi:cell division protein 45 [Encephalitozoon intestinalis]
MLDIGNPIGIINKFKSYRSVRIFIPDIPSSVCAAKIITEILHKELIRFEMDFQPEKVEHHSDQDLNVFIDLDPRECKNFLSLCGQENSSLQGSWFVCTCKPNWIHSCMLAYSLAKAMNYVTTDVLWAMIVCFGFHRIFTKDLTPVDDLENESNFSDSICAGCRELHADLVFEIQRAGVLTDTDGLYYVERPCISFLNFTSLFSALQNDIPFVVSNKIYYKKNKSAEAQRICEYLARKGISREASYELYGNLGYSTKALIESHFRKRKCFVKKIGYGIEVSPIENFFLICHHLLKGARVDAFLCLSSREVLGMKESIKIHHELIWIYRDSLANIRKLGNILLFRINISETLKGMAIGVLVHLFEHYFDMYIRRRYSPSFRQMIIFQGYLEDRFIVTTDDPPISSELFHRRERLGGYVVMNRNELFEIIAKLKTKTGEVSSIAV